MREPTKGAADPGAGQKLSAVQLVQAASSVNVIQAIHVAAKLGIADLIKGGPRSIDELAERTGAHPRSLGRLLRTLAALGVFAEGADGKLGPTTASAMLESGRFGTARDIAVCAGEDFHWRAWGALHHSVMTGDSAFVHVHGAGLYDYLDAHPDDARTFFAAHSQAARMQDQGLLTLFDFSPFKQVVDIGGGDGTFLAQLLAKYPALRGVLFDLPQVVAQAPAITGNPALAARCELRGGSFFEEVPGGADGYILRGVPMDWDDARVGVLLQRCRDALSGDAQLLTALTLDGPAAQTRFLDLSLLVLSPAGRLRTEAELRALYEAAGLRVSRVARSPFSDGAVLVAVRA